MIIGLSGKAGCGKDTVADYLVETYGFSKISFAVALKIYAVKYFHLGWNACFKNPKSETTRRILQGLGLFVRDHLDENFWVNKLFSKIDEGFLETGEISKKAREKKDYVITDVRFPNEVQAIEGVAKGEVIRIIRPGTYLDGALRDHESETALDGYLFRFKLLNDGSFSQLHERVDEMIWKIGRANRCSS